MILRLLIKWGLPLLAALTVMSVADNAGAQSCPGTCPPPPCEDTGTCPPPPPPPCEDTGTCPPPPCEDTGTCPPPPCEDDCPPPQPSCGAEICINVNVDTSSEANAMSRAQSRVDSWAAGRGVGSGAGLGAGSGMGRGYASFGVQSPAPTAMSGFMVQGPSRVVRVPYRAQRSMMSRVTIQAVCMDARSVPHPASRVVSDSDIRDDFDGELYRCITGSWLQITMSGFESSESNAWCYSSSAYSAASYQREEYSQGSYQSGGQYGGQGGGYAQGSSSGGQMGGGYGRFQCRDGAPPDCVRAAQSGVEMPGFCLTGGGGGGGQTMTCRQGEALYHNRGGRLECRPQTPQRDCFERSLLRRYGAGVFTLTMMREESYEEWREETVVETYSGMNVVFDGGVGGRVY